tara:strand:- start:1046 stop:1348 length:303 start_codon:yes stop_codon:yes gene_type:complete
MPKEKKFVQYVEPQSTDYLEYKVLGRSVKEGVKGDEHIVRIKKICRGNPEETFETEEVVSYVVPHPEPEVVEVVEPVKEKSKRVALGVIPLPDNFRKNKK